MRNLRVFSGTGLGAIATFVALVIPLRAQPTILDVIELGPILARHDVGNALGLAFDPQLNVFYIAHGSDTRGAFIYTLDAQGRLLDEYDFLSAYGPGSFLESLSYDEASGHLFALAEVPVGTDFVAHLLELEPGTFTVLTDQVIDNAGGGGGGIHVRTDGIWQARFAEDVIRHYSRALALIDDVSVAASFPGFPGPLALTSSFRGGFFLVDLFGSRLVEVDVAGHQIAEASTAMLRGFGRALAIDIDRASRRIFLQVENSAIYVLSDEFIRPGPTVVVIDVKPGSVPNSINPRSRGVIAVAILTTATFDAATVNPSSVRFGPHGAIAARGHMEDVDGDGDLDWLFHFRTEETGVQCGDRLVSLTAETLGGLAIQGTDPIVTVGCK
jgi:hypothetical protein